MGACCLEAGQILQHPHSLLGTTATGHCWEADHRSWSPALLVRNNEHTASVWWIAGDKTGGNINQMLRERERESCHLMSWVETFQFLYGSRQAVGGKNIFLKLPHINIRSTAAKIRTE